MPVDYTVPAIDRAVRLLEILSLAPQGRSLAQLADELGVPKSTLFRILHTLEEHAVVAEDPDRKLFTLGMRLLEWGHAALSRIDLKTVAHPTLQKLAHETRESFYLAILDHDDVIIVDHVDTPEVWKMVTRLGHRSPVHCTATGLVLAADLEADDLERLVGRKGLKKYTDATITGLGALKRRLAKIRQDGHSIVDGEYKPDLCAIAVPLRDHSGRVVASLMTAIPSERYRKNKRRAKELIAILSRSAGMISQRLGYNSSKLST
ncbi:MAG: IclR family transcriptional regulator [Ignavibacteriales bacterium]|nr:IclR family transcriptional regulator [Ignavibacteriales bacterium]